MELYELGIKAAQDGLAKGDFTSADIVKSVIARCHEKNAEIGAYLTFDEEQALALAEANPKAVPIAVKDLIIREPWDDIGQEPDKFFVL